MTNPNGGRYEERRESIGSIRIRWRLLHSILFVIQALPGMAFITWAELTQTTNDSTVDTAKAIIWGVAVVGGASIATTGLFAEVLELMLGTRDLINDWLQKRRDEARKQGRAEVLEWVKRRDAAREKGEPFDEPPPGTDEKMN